MACSTMVKRPDRYMAIGTGIFNRAIRAGGFSSTRNIPKPGEVGYFKVLYFTQIATSKKHNV